MHVVELLQRLTTRPQYVVVNPAANDLLDSTAEETTCPVMPGTPVDKTAAEAAGLFRDYRRQ